MSRIPADSLLLAAFRTVVQEDQLTEMLAHTIDHDDDFCTALRPSLEVPPTLRKLSVLTQRRTPTGDRRIDLELRFGGNGEHIVWIEVKDHSPESEGQLATYKAELQRHWPDAHSLIALASAGHDILSNPVARSLTWQTIARTCERVGAARAGRQWRTAAANSRSEARQRSLADFIEFLKGRSLALSTEPIMPIDSLVAPRAEALLAANGTIAQVLDTAVAFMTDFENDVANRWPKQGIGAWRCRPSFHRTQESRTCRHVQGGPAFLRSVVRPNDEWDRPQDPRNAPAFAGGIWFSQTSPGLMNKLASAATGDIFINAEPKDCSVRKLLYLGELAAVGTTPIEQGEALGTWAQAAIGDVARFLRRCCFRVTDHRGDGPLYT